MKLKIHDFDLPLRHTFTISRESVTLQPTVIVELEADGVHGYGEATTNSYYGFTSANLRSAIESVRAEVEGTDLASTDPDVLWTKLSTKLSDNPFALCAIDQAAHDLWGKLRGQAVYQLWGLSMETAPASCFTIGIDTIETMVRKLKAMPGWPVYKIKLGTDRDVEIIRALRAETEATFRVDANCGWGVEEALDNAKALQPLGVEFIEQPLKADDWDGHKKLFTESALPILADESCIVEADVARCIGHFHGINIKLVKCGGLTPARRMIHYAKENGLQVMVGCMTESTVGISAIAQLLPLLDYVDMDGAELLAEDIASGVKVRRGVCEFPSTPGHGVSLFGSGTFLM